MFNAPGDDEKTGDRGGENRDAPRDFLNSTSHEESESYLPAIEISYVQDGTCYAEGSNCQISCTNGLKYDLTKLVTLDGGLTQRYFQA